MRTEFKKTKKVNRLELFTVVRIDKTDEGYDINIKNDNNDYIDMCTGVPANVLFNCMEAEDIDYMLERDLDECGYFALMRPERDKIRSSAKGYKSAKYPRIYVNLEDWDD